MIDIEKTALKFGYNPLSLKQMSTKLVVYLCPDCNKSWDRVMSDVSRSKTPYCSVCAKIHAHKDLGSGYNKESYKKKRSEIAIKSNKTRKTSSEKFKKYLPYVEEVRLGKMTFTALADILKIDDSTVCKFFHSNFNIKSKFGGKSLQGDKVYNLLVNIFGDVQRQIKYSEDLKNRSDFYIESLGHIEYDGSGFYHFSKTKDTLIDSNYNPIRLNAQALFGGEEYLRLKLLNERTGYCAVTSVKDYKILKLDNCKSSNEMIENCHPLGSCAGSISFGLFFNDKLIGVAKFGAPTDKNESGLELRRFFVLDGTPKNTESFFLRSCERLLPAGTRLISYIHSHEKGSSLKATGWTKINSKSVDYDFYLINGKIISKRRVFGWAKKTGLVDKLGTTLSKEFICNLMGGKKIILPSKIKFIKEL